MGEALSGDFEQLVLLAILRLDQGAYAVPIRREIERTGDRAVSRGALYTTLERLEAKDLVRSRLGESRPERGGRARRYYAVTAAGVEALRAARRTLERLWQGLEVLAEKSP